MATQRLYVDVTEPGSAHAFPAHDEAAPMLLIGRADRGLSAYTDEGVGSLSVVRSSYRLVALAYLKHIGASGIWDVEITDETTGKVRHVSVDAG